MEKSENSKNKENILENMSVSSSVLGKLFSLGDSRIRQLAQDGILKRTSKGKYKLAESIVNYVRFLKISKELETEKSFGEVDYELEKGKNERVKRMQNELKLAVMKGELYKAEQIEQVMGDVIIAFKGKILGIPSKAAPMLVDRQDAGYIREILNREVTEALAELKAYDPLDFYDKDYVRFIMEDETEGVNDER